MKVLVLGRLQAAMDTVLPMLRDEGFGAIGTLIDDEAVEHLRSEEFAAIVIGGSVEQDSRRRIRSLADERGIASFEVEQGNKVIETYISKEM